MRQWIVVHLILGAALGSASAGPAPKDAPGVAGEGKTLALVGVGNVDPAMVDRVRAFVEEQTAVPVRLEEARPEAGESLQADGESLADAVGPHDLCLVALALPVRDASEHAVYLYDRNIAVVNARALKPASGDMETYGRRLEKVVMRSYGLLMGLEQVPNPHSALWPYRNLEELDAIGRGFDPPTLWRFQEIAKERGARLLRDSPFYRD
jgi:hypothetical protein